MNHSAGGPLCKPRITPSIREVFDGPLIDWYRRHQRPLPWRSRPTPYRILIAEFMLQQTRVDQGLPYYHRFLKRFPNVSALASAPLEEVLVVWEGLGYYRRAHHLHQTAELIMTRHRGRLPRDLEALRALPGIGPYTAAAVGSIAFGLPAAAVDGNVLRVLARVFAFSGDIAMPASRAVLADLARRLLDPHNPGRFNQAVMELGSQVCTPADPACHNCPLQGACRAAKRGHPGAFPRKSAFPPRPHYLEAAAVIRNRQGALLLRRRPDRGLLGGLWEFPAGRIEPGESGKEAVARLMRAEWGLQVSTGDHMVTLRHGYSHFQVTLEVYRARRLMGSPPENGKHLLRWVPTATLCELPMSRLHRRVIACLPRSITE